ncbi:hypothetical protein C8R48DRAFT_290273 [Suillus tomentosus]|nr:hypothetical protein C8R48DRAFT_290273 [Suillus tomentosus]
MISLNPIADDSYYCTPPSTACSTLCTPIPRTPLVQNTKRLSIDSDTTVVDHDDDFMEDFSDADLEESNIPQNDSDCSHGSIERTRFKQQEHATVINDLEQLRPLLAASCLRLSRLSGIRICAQVDTSANIDPLAWPLSVVASNALTPSNKNTLLRSMTLNNYMTISSPTKLLLSTAGQLPWPRSDSPLCCRLHHCFWIRRRPTQEIRSKSFKTDTFTHNATPEVPYDQITKICNGLPRCPL